MNLALKPTRIALLACAAALLVVDVACLIVLCSPSGRSLDSRNKQIAQMQEDLQKNRQENLPLINIEGKLLSAQQQVSLFRQTAATAADSELSEHLHKLAELSHVRLNSASYSAASEQDSKLGELYDHAGLRRMNVAVQISGEYEHLMEFVNALERSEVLFVVDDVQMRPAEKGAGGMAIHVETFVRKEQQ